MAKEAKTKTEIIREALAKWPELTTGEIAQKINHPGIAMAYVSSIKSMDAKRAKKSRRRVGSRGKTKGRSRRVVSMTALRKAKELAAEVGGITQLRILLDLLDDLK
ncbi:MAG TPA: hypothetical protein VNN80_23745 [Polyangiaceae bacterium]|nr:hypothetical protein [Polyangiaceae bacterium]